MPLPVTAPAAQAAYLQLRQTMAALKGYLPNFSNVAGFTGNTLLGLLNLAAQVLAQTQAIQASPALASAVLALYTQDAGVSVTAAQVTASNAALTNLITALVAEFPKAADGTHLAYQTLGADGAVKLDTFQQANFPNTVAAVTAWLATVS